MTRIGIEPSMQDRNIGVCPGYIESEQMKAIGDIVVARLKSFGAPGIEARLFWNGSEGGDNYVGQTAAADAWADILVSFHSDSAGDQDNDGRGYTGSLLCYADGDPAGFKLGKMIQQRMKLDFGWPDAGASERGGTLAVLDDFHGPSCLVEIGNHSDPQDCVALQVWREKFAEAIAWGIFAYLGINPKRDQSQEEDEVADNMFLPGPVQLGPRLIRIPQADTRRQANGKRYGNFILAGAKTNAKFPLKIGFSIVRNDENVYEYFEDIQKIGDTISHKLGDDYAGPIDVFVGDNQPEDCFYADIVTTPGV